MSLQIDETTGLSYLIKRPGAEARNYAIDFRRLIPIDSTIVNINALTILPQGIVTDTIPLAIANPQPNGQQIRFLCSGGTPKENYEIQAEVVDSAGNIIIDSILVKVRYANATRNI